MYYAHCLLYKSVSMYCLYVIFFCTVWSTLSRISLTKAHVLWWCDIKSDFDLIWYTEECPRWYFLMKLETELWLSSSKVDKKKNTSSAVSTTWIAIFRDILKNVLRNNLKLNCIHCTFFVCVCVCVCVCPCCSFAEIMTFSEIFLMKVRVLRIDSEPLVSLSELKRN